MTEPEYLHAGLIVVQVNCVHCPPHGRLSGKALSCTMHLRSHTIFARFLGAIGVIVVMLGQVDPIGKGPIVPSGTDE